MPFRMYILQSTSTGRFYVGHSSDLEDRLPRHQQGRSKATKGRGPWVLVYSEEFQTRPEAVKREQQIKAWKSADAIRRLIR